MKKLLYYEEQLEKEKSKNVFYLLKKNIKCGRIFDFEVVSNCMSPLLKTGDKISIRNIAPDALRRGDIIVYKMGDHLRVHRYIYKIQKNDNFTKLVTKPDAIPHFNKYLITSEELFGKVILIKKSYIEINLESPFWKINNSLLSLISYLQVYIVRFCYFIKRFFWGDRNLYFTSLIRKFIIFSLSVFLKFIIFTPLLISRLKYQNKYLQS